jgi:transcriptional regulator with XRE-family HTH domain
MWLDNLKELKKKTGMSSKFIAEKTNLPERTVSRIFSGDTDAPRVDTLRRIVAVLGGSLDDIFAESGSVVANTDMIALQAEFDKLLNEATEIKDENVSLKDKVARLEVENDRLKLKLEHNEKIISLQEEIISLHKLKSNN